MDEECHERREDGYFYRPQASVWAHAAEFFARSNIKDGFRDLIHSKNSASGVYISKASYADIMIASAKYRDNILRIVLYPRKTSGPQIIRISGLTPYASYISAGCETVEFSANVEGYADLSIIVDGRTDISIRRKV